MNLRALFGVLFVFGRLLAALFFWLNSDASMSPELADSEGS